ncbi:MAG: DUF4466 family protein [Candidatus Azobacteroides sp.]|nr:DUF4466 family protein [Candidatus Azobacteroides sp.]
MKHIKYISGCIAAVCLIFSFTSCDNDSEDPTSLQNKCIYRTIGPHVWGLEIEFAYAMAIPPEMGHIVSAQVEASIAGSPETWMEHHSYHTNSEGLDTGIEVGLPSVNDGKVTMVEFTKDTCAATLRYYYNIPEEAKGQNVTFTFSARASNGETVSCIMGPYKIAEMDMKLDIEVSSAKCYLSIEDMEVYTAEEAAAVPEKIDLVYLYRNYSEYDIDFNHAFVAPAADADKYLPGVTLPEGVNRDTRIRDVGILDAHLAHLHLNDPPETQPALFIDDIDLREMDMENMPNWALDIIKNDGMWIETQDGKYRAYIFANDMRRGRAGGTLSMKRLKMY